MIRKANTKDIKGIIALLHQVNMVHHVIRPDLFKPNTTKYNEQELETLLSDDSMPVFVYDDGEIRGHAFCQVNEVRDHRLLVNVKTLYIDDICVDESERGKHIGKALYEHVHDYAKSIGCHNITLNEVPSQLFTPINHHTTSPFTSLNCYIIESVQENKSITIKKKKELWKI